MEVTMENQKQKSKEELEKLEKADKIKKDLENRFSYHSPKEGQADQYQAIRNMAKDFAMAIVAMAPDTRERALAITKLEEVVFWANAGIARHE